MSTPFVTSAVNGIKIPLHPGQTGIMHRFDTPENKLFISAVHEKDGDINDDTKVLSSASTAENEVPTVSSRVTAEGQALKLAQLQLAEQAEAMKAMQAQMAQFMAAQAAPAPVALPLASTLVPEAPGAIVDAIIPAAAPAPEARAPRAPRRTKAEIAAAEAQHAGTANAANAATFKL